MTHKPKKPRSEADAELEREIRKERKFSLGEAIGRLAGPGCMKGASPVARTQQAAAEIQHHLRDRLTDPGGVLAEVLVRHIQSSDLLLQNLDEDPLAVLAQYVRRVLNSPYLLNELVRDADVEWGRMHDERPIFEREGLPPRSDDPYTVESVRIALLELSKD
ncbi:MAG TPA: hypothetical protein VGI81_07845 [Tepidisphaeraceae bacterium]|jgi:hypothetical protein